MNEINRLIEDKPKLRERVSDGLDRELKRQKEAGNKFISDEEIDTLVDKIIKKELSVISSSHPSPIIAMMKKYHEIGLELEKRKKVVTDIQDLTVIDLQIRTNKNFESDIINLAIELMDND